MRILSYEVVNDMLRATTDNPERPEFVYPADKFKNRGQLMREIQKSIDHEQKRKAKKQGCIKTVIEEINNARN